MKNVLGETRKIRNDPQDYLFQSYFRLAIPDIDREARLALHKRPAWIREHIAKTSMHPQVIEELGNDPNPKVKRAARLNHFWLYLGRYRRLVEKPLEQRMRLAASDPGPRLLTLLFYDSDYRVIREALNNPHLLNEQRHLFRKYCALRPLPEIDKHLKRWLTIKPGDHQLQKQNGLQALPIQRAQSILRKLSRNNPDPQAETFELVSRTDTRWLASHLRPDHPTWQAQTFPSLSLWKIFVRLRRISINQHRQPVSAQFRVLLAMLKLNVVRHCARDLTRAEHLLIMACAHSDHNRALRGIADKLLEIEALFEILDDPGTPVGISLPALKVLRRHPLAPARARAAEVLITLNKRSRAALREMEASIKAYFDIIANSHLSRRPGTSSPAHRGELTYLYDVVSQLRALPNQIFRQPPVDDGPVMAGNRKQIFKARLLWRATVGQYLGRIKSLSNSVFEEWVKHLNGHLTPEAFKQEFDKSNDAIEKEYKQSVKCNLSIRCVQCTKRTCAADRFLQQVEFLLGELLDFRT